MEYGKLWLDYDSSALKDRKVCLKLEDSGLIENSIREEIRSAFASAVSEDECDLLFVFEPGDEALGEEGYEVSVKESGVTVRASGSRGKLYGCFEALGLLRRGISDKEVRKIPSDPLRMLDHWDNIDGSIERGYSGKSFFFKDGAVTVTQRITDYARAVSSVGINAVCINNVNVRGDAVHLIDGKYRSGVKKIGEIFGRYGIRLYLSLNFASPKRIGGLDTADPLDPGVIGFWEKTLKDLMTDVPDIGGFVVKADSEGEPGPFAYGRTHADGANMLGRIIRPFGGILIWRCFVYNCQQDWRDKKTDRARSGYDNFIGLDGAFDDNVILQIKNGPMDFQIREPVHPLFGGLKKTNMMLEVQIAQEYTGQQIHCCYLIPMFKEILDFRTCAAEENDRVADIVSGKTYGNKNCGITAVANTGDDYNWTGHDLAAANLYGFGRLAFDNDMPAEEIAEEFITLTFGDNAKVRRNIKEILMMSREAYENYTSPLGIGWMVNPSHHYGPNVEGYEYDRWGTYHRADHMGIGVDRTAAGTGYTEQYNEPVRSMYSSVATCPEELLLFFHRIEYTHVLKSGKTLIQHIYDSHFEGAEQAEKELELWRELKDLIEAGSYERTLARFEEQYTSAVEWRDRINTYFHRISWIDDEKGRTIY